MAWCMGEQGDPMLQLLFSVGQHALEVVNRSLRDDEKVMAFLDDIYFCSEPNRVGVVYAVIEEALQHHAGISIHGARLKCGMRLVCAPQVVTC